MFRILREFTFGRRQEKVSQVLDTHDCEYFSECCGVGVAHYTELDHGSYGTTGFCGMCHDGSVFFCDVCNVL